MAGRGLMRTFGLLPRRPFLISVMAMGFLIWGLAVLALLTSHSSFRPVMVRLRPMFARGRRA